MCSIFIGTRLTKSLVTTVTIPMNPTVRMRRRVCQYIFAKNRLIGQSTVNSLLLLIGSPLRVTLHGQKKLSSYLRSV